MNNALRKLKYDGAGAGRRGQSRRLNPDRTSWSPAAYDTAIGAALMRALVVFIEDERNCELPRWLASTLAGQRIGRESSVPRKSRA